MKSPANSLLKLERKPTPESPFYELRRGPRPWGDYGDILIHGFSEVDDDECLDESPSLVRSGPFVPPITLPGFWQIIATDDAKLRFESSGLKGLSYVPAKLKSFIPIEWPEWDLLAEDPEFYPDSGEPESYLDEAKHSAALAAQAPKLWRIAFQRGGREIRVRPDPTKRHEVIQLIEGSWNGADIFCCDETYITYVTPKAKAWLESQFAAWVDFRPVMVHAPTI